MPAVWPGSPLQAAEAVEAAEADTGLGSGVDIGEGSGSGTVARKGDTCRAAQQKEEVEQRQDKMEEEGDSGSYTGEQRRELILTGDLEPTVLVLVLEELGVVEAEEARQQVGPVRVCPPQRVLLVL